jgi:hypothetical protein
MWDAALGAVTFICILLISAVMPWPAHIEVTGNSVETTSFFPYGYAFAAVFAAVVPLVREMWVLGNRHGASIEPRSRS